jgi:hypothetical protein
VAYFKANNLINFENTSKHAKIYGTYPGLFGKLCFS